MEGLGARARPGSVLQSTLICANVPGPARPIVAGDSPGVSAAARVLTLAKLFEGENASAALASETDASLSRRPLGAPSPSPLLPCARAPCVESGLVYAEDGGAESDTASKESPQTSESGPAPARSLGTRARACRSRGACDPRLCCSRQCTLHATRAAARCERAASAYAAHARRARPAADLLFPCALLCFSSQASFSVCSGARAFCVCAALVLPTRVFLCARRASFALASRATSAACAAARRSRAARLSAAPLPPPALVPPMPPNTPRPRSPIATGTSTCTRHARARAPTPKPAPTSGVIASAPPPSCRPLHTFSPPPVPPSSPPARRGRSGIVGGQGALQRGWRRARASFESLWAARAQGRHARGRADPGLNRV